MGRNKNNQEGFSIVETVLVLVVIALVCVVGYMVYKNHHKTSKTNSVASSSNKSTGTSTQIDAYAGWKMYTLPVEKLSFKYPADWKVNADGTGAPTSTQDQVTLDASDQYSLPTDQTAVGPDDTSGAVDAKNIAIGFTFKSPVTLAQAQSNSDVKNAELVIQSMHY